MSPDFLSQDELNTLSEVTEDNVADDLSKRVQHDVSVLRRRISNYSFNPGSEIFIHWEDESHPLKFDSFYGVIREAGKDVFYRGVYRNRVKKIPSISRRFFEDRSMMSALRAAYDPEIALNLELPYKREKRILLEGFVLNPAETGFGLSPRFEEAPRLFKNQLPGQLLLDLGYLKATGAYVGINGDLRRVIEDCHRKDYLSIIDGKPCLLLKVHLERAERIGNGLDRKVAERMGIKLEDGK